MAGGTFNAAFKIEGDVSNAVAAIQKLGKSMDRLTAAINKFVEVSENMGETSKRASKKAKAGYEAATEAVDKYSQAIVKANSNELARRDQLATTGASGGGGGTPPPTPPVINFDPSGINNVPAVIENITKSTNRARSSWAAFQSFMSSAGQKIKSIFMSMGTAALNFGKNILTSTRSAVSNLQGFLMKTSSAVASFRRTMMDIADGFRLAGQAITNVGRSLFFFVTIPVAGFLSKVMGTAVDFEATMVRVRKTAGLSAGQLKELTANIRELATIMPVAHTELAGIAAILGQMGVSDVTALTDLTEMFGILSVTADMSAEDVARDMGKIANAFGWSMSASREDVWKLANVINQLENTTAATTEDIMKSLMNWAQVANVLNISAADAAAFSASLIAMGFSAEESGTALRNVGLYMASNVDVLHELMKSNEKYSTLQKTINALNTDAAGVMEDLIEGASDYGNAVEVLGAFIELASKRGARGFQALSENSEFFAQNLQTARVQWEKFNSVMQEYNRATESTKASMQILKNNVNDVGMTIGDVVLPVVNDLAMTFIPFLQTLTAKFKALSPKVQQQIVLFTLLGLVAGPLLMFFGQIFHAITLLVMGFGQIMKVFPLVINAFVSLTKVAQFFLSVPGLIIAGIFVVLKVLQKMGVDVAGMFTSLAEKASAWGQNLMNTYANGLAAGAKIVLDIISWIANLIASFFEAHSPPEQGPLSSIDKWGSALLQTYLNGFKQADFSALAEVGRMIERELTRGISNDAMPAALEKVAEARVAFAKLTKAFNSTGVIDNSLLDDVVKNLGNMKEEIREVIRLQLQHNALVEELNNLEKDRANTVKAYQDEVAAIAASNMTVEEKVDAIRKARQEQDKNLRSIAQEEEAVNGQKDAVDEQLDLQKALVDAMADQDDILARISAALEALTRAMGTLGDNLPDFGGIDTSSMDDLKKAAEDMVAKMDLIQDRINKGKRALQGFSDGFINEKDKLTLDAFGGDQGLFAIYNTLFDIGQKAAEVKEKFEKWGLTIQNIKTFIDGLKTGNLKTLEDFGGSQGIYDVYVFVMKLIDGWNSLKGTLSQPISIKIEMPEAIQRIINAIKTALGPAIQNFVKSMERAFRQLKKAWEVLSETFKSPEGQQALKLLASVAVVVLGLVVGVLSGLIEMIGKAIANVAILIHAIALQIAGVINFVVGFVNVIRGLLTGNIDLVKQGFSSMAKGVVQYIQSMIGTAIFLWNWFFGNIIQGIVGFVRAVINFFVGLSDDLVGNSVIPDMINAIIQWFVNLWNSVTEWVANLVATVVQWFVDLWNSVVEKVTGLWTDVVSWFTSLKTTVVFWVTTLKNAVVALWGELKQTVITKVTALKTEVIQKWIEFKNKTIEKFNEVKTEVVGIFNNIKSEVERIAGKFFDIGRNLVQGLIDGIKSAAGAVKNAISSVTTKATETANRLWKVQSPSRVFMEIGSNLSKGLALGITDELPMVEYSAKSLVTAAMPDFSGMAVNASRDIPYATPPKQGDTYHIEINNPVVRDDKDLQRITDAVIRAIERRTRANSNFGYGGGV